MSEESNLVAHARFELKAIGEEPEVIEGYLKVVQAFADMRHSGGSAMVAVPIITDLLSFKNLSPLTSDPTEWVDVGYDGHVLWQNNRRCDAFSKDGGKTYYLLDSPGIHLSNAPRKRG